MDGRQDGGGGGGGGQLPSAGSFKCRASVPLLSKEMGRNFRVFAKV